MSDPCNTDSTVGSAIQRKLRKGAKFNYDFVAVASRLVAAGMTEKDIGYVLGVKPTTIKKWKQRYSEFKDACAGGKEVAKQYLVAKGLRTAMGYDYEEVDQVLKRVENPDYDPDDPDSERTVLVVDKETRKLKHRPVDKDLLIFFLINMDRGNGEWKNSKSIEVEQKKTTTNINLTGEIEAETIRKLAGAALKEADTLDKKVKKVESEVIDG